MLFSFVIPSYNRAEKLCRAIDSIIKQPNWESLAEIIVVDDGSTDDTEEKLTNFLKNKQMKLIKHQTNLGVASAKNTGIRNAKNKYVVLLDSDDFLIIDGLKYLEKKVNEIKADLFFFGSQSLTTGKLLYNDSFKGLKSYFDILTEPVGEYLPVCKTTVIKENLLKNLRGFESITWLRIAQKGFKVYYDTQSIRVYDDIGEDRISNRFGAVKNADKMKKGYQMYLDYFGFDLKYLKYNIYLKLKFKFFCYWLLSFFSSKK